MNEIVSDVWTWRGVSVIWDAGAAHRVAEQGLTVSLREALKWADNMPPTPPGGVRGIVVTGLQDVLDVFNTIEEIDALLLRVHNLIRAHSLNWTDAAIVFLVQDEKRFHVSVPSGSLHMRSLNNQDIDLGRGLWHGTAREARPIAPHYDESTTGATIGYWLRRVS